MQTDSKPRLLIAVLNWGLGHATRCIPIVKALERCGFALVIASDGAAKTLLEKEFPHLEVLELPGYGITYGKNRKEFKRHLRRRLPEMWSAIRAENKMIASWHETYHFAGVISDNRPGVFLKGVPSVYITHQLRVLSGRTTFLTTMLHRIFMNKFDAWWIPDAAQHPGLSGKLGHIGPHAKTTYIGPISRFKPIENAEVKYDVLVLLSGPEPARTQFEKKLLPMARATSQTVLFVRGTVMPETSGRRRENNLEIVDYLTSAQIQTAIAQSRTILCRSGYSTILDLNAMQCKRCFFVPTPGQYEQEYLARELADNRIAPFGKQEEFKWEMLESAKDFNGFTSAYPEPDWQVLFGLFNRK